MIYRNGDFPSTASTDFLNKFSLSYQECLILSWTARYAISKLDLKLYAKFGFKISDFWAKQICNAMAEMVIISQGT